MSQHSPLRTPLPHKCGLVLAPSRMASCSRSCLDVLNGLGMSYKQGHEHAPGYLVLTWQTREDLLTIGARLGFGRSTVTPQNQKRVRPWDEEKEINNGQVDSAIVYPDCVIESDDTRPRMLLDAKYKVHVEKSAMRIAEADIYEAFAFSKAAGCNRIILAYPAQLESIQCSPGSCSAFERVEIDNVQRGHYDE